MNKRYIKDSIINDLEEKIVLLCGPRQVGKTTLSKGLDFDTLEYLNYDSVVDRKKIVRLKWSRKSDLLIFDELHKMKKWKSWIKGIYDTEGVRPRILVTGSARLDIYRKGGDSLAGRHHLHHLHPFSVAELTGSENSKTILEKLLLLGGFPEPYLKGTAIFAQRWRKSHLERILQEDVQGTEAIRDIKNLEFLVELLSERVGSTISYRSLAQDLQVAPQTVKRWTELLERMFIVFSVSPYSKNLARAIQKEPKYYFYDTGRVIDQGGARLENLVACALHKRNQFLEDTLGEKIELYFVKNRDQSEVDFLTVRQKKLEFLIEVKVSDDHFSKSLGNFYQQLNIKQNNPGFQAIQLVQNLEIKKTWGELKMFPAHEWLSQLEA